MPGQADNTSASGAPGAVALCATPVVVVDLEMTGLDVARDRIVEIGAVRAVGDQIVEELSLLVRPDVPMSSDARRMTGLDDAALADAPGFAEVAPAITRLLDGALLVGHRVDFDHAFLVEALRRLGQPPPAPPAFDTLEMARNLLSLRSHSLASVCEMLGVERPVAHRALPDARATWEVFRRLVGLVDPEGALTPAETRVALDALRASSPQRRRWRDLLDEALLTRRSVWIQYISRDDGRGTCLTQREVEPWDIGAGRMAGFCHLRGAHRVFRLDRMCGVSVGGRAYQIPAERPALVR